VRLEINILSPLVLYEGERADLPDFVEIGKHGLYMRKDQTSGVLLPSVPVSYGWDSTTFLERTCNKAGFELDCWKKPEYEVYYYDSVMFREERGEKLFDKSFGPADTQFDETSEDLQGFLTAHLDNFNKTKEGVRALIVPHAGYYYSANTAAHAYKNYEPGDKTVIVVGPSHFMGFQGVSVLHAEEYESKLGSVKIDTDFVKELDELIFVNDYEAAFIREHSIELQINWLKILGAQKVVLAVVGNINLDDINAFAEMLVENNADLVVSVDFSHYYNQTTAEKLDSKCLESILGLDEQKLIDSYVLKECELDSMESVLILLNYVKKKALQAEALHYETSSAYSGDYERVVGYHAIVFTEA
jgi:AmmeMemoRadiSam system protein B